MKKSSFIPVAGFGLLCTAGQPILVAEPTRIACVGDSRRMLGEGAFVRNFGVNGAPC